MEYYWLPKECMKIHKLPQAISEADRIFIVPFITKYPLRHSQKCRYIILGNSDNGKSLCLTSLENSYQILPKVKISKRYKELDSLTQVLNKIVRKHFGKERNKLDKIEWVEPSDTQDPEIALSRYKKIKLSEECFSDSESEEFSLDELDFSDIEDSFPTDVIQPRVRREVHALDSSSDESAGDPLSLDDCILSSSPQTSTSDQSESAPRISEPSTECPNRPIAANAAKGKVFVKPLQSLQASHGSRSEYTNTQTHPSTTFMYSNPPLYATSLREMLSTPYRQYQRSQEKPAVHWHSPASANPQINSPPQTDSERLSCLARKRAHGAAFSSSSVNDPLPSHGSSATHNSQIRASDSACFKGPSEPHYPQVRPRNDSQVPGSGPVPLVSNLRAHHISTPPHLAPNSSSPSVSGVTGNAAPVNHNYQMVSVTASQSLPPPSQPLSALQKTVSDVHLNSSVRSGNVLSHPSSTSSHSSNPTATLCNTSVIRSPASICRTNTTSSGIVGASNKGYSSQMSTISEYNSVNNEHSQENLLDCDGHAMSILELDNVIPMLRDEIKDLMGTIDKLQATLKIKKQSLSKYDQKQHELNEIRSQKRRESENLKARIIMLRENLMQYNIQGGSSDKQTIHLHIRSSEEHQQLVMELQKLTGRNVSSSVVDIGDCTNSSPAQNTPMINSQNFPSGTGEKLQRESTDLAHKVNVLHDLFYTSDKANFADAIMIKHLGALGFTTNLVEAYFQKLSPQDKLFVANNMAYRLHHYLLRATNMKIETLSGPSTAAFLRFLESIVRVLNYLHTSYNVRINDGGYSSDHYHDLLAGIHRRAAMGMARNASAFPQNQLAPGNVTPGTSTSVSWQRPAVDLQQQPVSCAPPVNQPVTSHTTATSRQALPSEGYSSFVSPGNPNGMSETHSDRLQTGAPAETSVTKPEVSKPSCIVAPWVPRHVVSDNANSSANAHSSPCGVSIDQSPDERGPSFSNTNHKIDGNLEQYQGDSTWKKDISDGGVNGPVLNVAQPSIPQMSSFPYKAPTSENMFSTALSMVRPGTWSDGGTQYGAYDPGETYPGSYTTMGQDVRDSSRGATYPQHFTYRGPPI